MAAGSSIKMKVLRHHSPAGLGGSEDVQDDSECLIKRPSDPFRNYGRKVLRIILILCLLASFITVITIIVKEWYFLAHQVLTD